ncbi:MAG: tRNA (N6-threonylcarbamoyladenosine(37)-N6)-methyltransferase TrmO [Spirochaetales bacterium]|nr:tRNA (N6-threonylcarbamoyladenosine(37)-N6)-methyltransferase TrmO [Spirochaetales bacterium]
MYIKLKQIGSIKTPYTDHAPYQPVDDEKDNFRIIVNNEYFEGLLHLEDFIYIYVIYYIDRLKKEISMHVSPPWTNREMVGIFASRAPNRPNSIGISIVKIKKIIKNEIVISGIDVFNDTPLLDIKPYIKELDSKKDANYGWIDGLEGDTDHLLLHIRGIPHGY